MWVGRIGLRQTELLGAKAQRLAQMLLHVGAIAARIAGPQADVVIEVEAEPVAAQLLQLRLGPALQASHQGAVERLHRAACCEAQRARLGLSEALLQALLQVVAAGLHQLRGLIALHQLERECRHGCGGGWGQAPGAWYRSSLAPG